MYKLKLSECSILPLVLKGKWYDKIASGEKTEEYRSDTTYWRKRISAWIMRHNFGGHLVIAFSRGYRKADSAELTFIPTNSILNGASRPALTML